MTFKQPQMKEKMTVKRASTTKEIMILIVCQCCGSSQYHTENADSWACDVRIGLTLLLLSGSDHAALVYLCLCLLDVASQFAPSPDFDPL